MTADRTDAQSPDTPPSGDAPPSGDTPQGDTPPSGDAPEPWAPASVQEEFVHQSIDAVIITDPDHRVRIWNPAAVGLYGITAAEATGRTIGELLETVDTTGRSIDREVELASLEDRGVWQRRIVHRPLFGPRAGESVVVDSIVTVLRGTDGALGGALAVNRDVTAASRLESELAALGSLVVATGRARSKVEVADAALEILCRATGADAGLVTSSDQGYEATAHRGIRQATIDAVVSYGQLGGPLAVALAAPNAFVSADVVTAPLREDVREAVIADGIERLIVVGLRLAGRLTGILALGWRQRHPVEPSRPIMHQAAALVAASMENARLIAAVESGLTEERLLTRRMRALVELTRLPESAVAGGSGIQRLMREIASVIGADGSAFARVVDGSLVLDAVDQLDRERAGGLINRPVASVPMAAALSGGSAAVLFALTDPTITPEAAALTAERGYRSAAAFAIRDEDRLIGVLFSIFRRPLEDLAIDERTLDSIGRVLDISFANRRLREGVSASERRYRQLFEASPDALLVRSGDGVVIDANPAAVRLYGGELIGRPVDELIADDDADPERGLIALDGLARSVGLGRRLDGSTFPAEVDLRPIDTDDQSRTLAIVRDVTERTRMQAELIQAQKMDAIGMLVAGVAHELNNPLAAIVGFSHLIRTDPNLPIDLRHQADLLVQEANRTRVIVQNLLDFARLRPPERVEMELRPLLDSVLGLQSYVLDQNHLTVDIDIPADLPRLSVDRSQIQQVLINLTVNAAQAIRELGRPGTIRIRARAGEDDGGRIVRIEVADDGPGVPAGIVGRLFMPFVTTKEPGAGTGLGLSVSFGIVASHGGTLRHERNAQGGATFTIELPVERDEAPRPIFAASAPARTDVPHRRPRGSAKTRTAAETATKAVSTPARARPTAARGPEPPPPVPSRAAHLDAAVVEPAGSAADRDSAGGSPHADTSGGRRVRVLVLDDEPAIRELLARVLTRRGIEPVLAESGAAALEIVRTDPPDAILCDHRMAGMSGTEFHSAVMAIAPGLAEHFAFMSGDVLNPGLREFAEDRGVRLVAKPFDFATVGRLVDGLIGVEPG